MKFNYESYEDKQLKSSTSNKSNWKYNVGYFKLKDNGDEAIVRFPYTSTNDFDLVTVHTVQIGNSYKDISCLRSSVEEDILKCPLCSLGDDKLDMRKIRYIFYVKLIEYVQDKDGTIKPIAKIWRRPIGFAKELKSYFEEYGDISNQIFKIKRQGAAGSRETKYNILPANPTIYKSDVYVKNFDDFKDFDLSHHSYMVKTKEEIEHYLSTGEFPPFKKETAVDDSQVKHSTPEKVSSVSTTNSIDTNTSTAVPLRKPRTYSF